MPAPRTADLGKLLSLIKEKSIVMRNHPYEGNISFLPGRSEYLKQRSSLISDPGAELHVGFTDTALYIYVNQSYLRNYNPGSSIEPKPRVSHLY